MKLAVNGADKSFGKKKAVEHIDLSVEEGTIHGLLGSNGAGKTTLMKVMSGIYKADTGSVTYDDNNIFENPSVKSDVIFMHDIPFFFKGATLKKMAKFYKTMYKNWSDDRFRQLAAHFGIVTDKQLNQMSKGMKRQAAFILAFSARPKVMLLDEPFDGLDPIMRKQVKNILMQDIANHNMTVVASSHNLREMEDLCDSVSIMHDGKFLYHKELTDIRGTHCKLQIAFKEMPCDEFFTDLNIVHHKTKGRIITCIVKGNIDQLEEKVTKYNPLMYDILPLTLEEIFTYEMGELGYEISNIIVE